MNAVFPAMLLLLCCREGDNEYRCLGAGMRAKQILMIKAQVSAAGHAMPQQQRQHQQQQCS